MPSVISALVSLNVPPGDPPPLPPDPPLAPPEPPPALEPPAPLAEPPEPPPAVAEPPLPPDAPPAFPPEPALVDPPVVIPPVGVPPLAPPEPLAEPPDDVPAIALVPALFAGGVSSELQLARTKGRVHRNVKARTRRTNMMMTSGVEVAFQLRLANAEHANCAVNSMQNDHFGKTRARQK